MIVAAVFMKAGKSKLLSLLLSMQIISYLPLYKVDFPAELEMYIEAIRKIAEFDILPTETIKDELRKNEVFGTIGEKSID